MKTRKLIGSAIAVATLAASMLTLMTPADAWWCRFGRCGWGYRGPGIYVGAGPYYPGPYYNARPRGYFVCPHGFHWAADGGDCVENR